MNPQFLDIAKKAGLYFDTSGRWANADAVETFAELIVERCIAITNEVNHSYVLEDVIRREFNMDAVE